MSRYNPARNITPAFIERVTDWISVHGEVLVVVRRVGGFCDFALCRSRAEFEQLVAQITEGTEIIVFRHPQLPIRGPVDETLIARALAVIPDGAEYLAITIATKPGCPLSARVGQGDSHADLKETLRDWWGVDVAVGQPDVWIADHEGMISRAKGGVEGPSQAALLPVFGEVAARRALSNETPFVAMIDLASLGNPGPMFQWHFVVSLALAHNELLFHDPADGPDRRVPLDDFLAAWATAGYRGVRVWTP